MPPPDLPREFEPTKELIDTDRALPYSRGRWSLENSTDQEKTASIRENFLKGDRIYIGLNPKIGDMVQATAFLTGLKEAQNILGSNTPITLLTPIATWDVFEPLAKKYNFEMIASNQLQTMAHADNISAERGEKNCLLIEMDYLNGEAEVGKHQHNGAVRVRDLFSSFNARYNNETAGRARYAKFVEDFLGLKEDVLNPDKCLPEIPLPEDAPEIYRRIIAQYGIDPSKEQVAISLEASTPGRMYDHWEKVIQQLKTDLGDQAEINIIYNSKKSPHEVTQVDLNVWSEIIKKYPGVRLVNGSLKEITVALANQSVVIAADSGLSHIAGAIEGGPKVIPLYIPPQAEEKYWGTNPDRMSGISAPTEGRDLSSPIGGDMSTNPDKKWINRIAPEAIAKKAERLLRSSGENPNYPGSREQAVQALYQDILGKSKDQVDPEELQNLVNSDKPVEEVATEMRNSDEFRKNAVTILYKTIFDREPDPIGLELYTRTIKVSPQPGEKGYSPGKFHLDTLRAISEVRKALVHSDEFRNKIQLLAIREGREKTIRTIYQRVLGREIDPTGISVYIDGEMPVEDVISSTADSEEFQQGYL